MSMDIITNPILLIALPLLFAFIAVFIKKIDKVLLGLAALINTVISVLIAIYFTGTRIVEIGGFTPPFGINLQVSAYTLISIIVLNVLFLLIMVMSFENVGKYAAVVTVSLAALNGMILTDDLFNLFVFMEIAAITAYIITTMNKGYKHTFNYLVLGTLGSGLFLLGIILLYNIFGSLNMISISYLISNLNVPLENVLALPLLLIFSGMAVEAKLIPFGGWVKGVLKKSNSLVGALIVSAFAFTILSVFGKLIFTLFVMSDALLIGLTIISVATLIFAEVSAFSKKNLREVLLFSSIAQSGLIMLLFINGLITVALMVLISNVLSKLIMFTIAGKLAKDLKTDETAELKGVFSKYKGLGISFTVAAMSLIGLPFFFGFIAKINALVAMFEIGNYWLPIIVLAMAVIEGAYFMRILTTLWNSGEEGELASKDKQKVFNLDGCMRVGIVSLLVAILIIAVGVLPIANLKEFFRVDFMTFLKSLLGGM